MLSCGCRWSVRPQRSCNEVPPIGLLHQVCSDQWEMAADSVVFLLDGPDLYHAGDLREAMEKVIVGAAL